VAILGTTLEEEARLAAILGTTKCRCLHVFTLDLYVHMTCDLVYVGYCDLVYVYELGTTKLTCVGYCDL
jgi:hypothetical protein